MTGETVTAFIPELLRAANEPTLVTEMERANLLRRAASTIRDYRIEIDYSDTPANDSGGPDDIVYRLNEMARRIKQFSATEVSETLVEAIGVIRAAKILLDAKHEVEGGE